MEMKVVVVEKLNGCGSSKWMLRMVVGNLCLVVRSFVVVVYMGVYMRCNYIALVIYLT